tara:strand:- start:474 stop:638 length:165 start_codon:yes stop_codon:yes gene_type:complete
MCQFFAQCFGQKFYMPIGMILAGQEPCQPPSASEGAARRKAAVPQNILLLKGLA